MRILIADDDPVYRSFLESLLSDWGFEVISTQNGREAYEALAGDRQIPLAVLDWMMPEMDGYEVCRQVKSQPWGQSVYTIIITGTRLTDNLPKVLVAGADDYIIKPFEPLDLKIRVHAAKRIIDLREEVEALRTAAGQAAHENV